MFVFLFIAHECGACTRVCLVHRCIHPACRQAGQKLPGVFLNCSLCCLLKQTISLNLELSISAKLSGKQIPGIHCLPTNTLELQVHCHAQFLMWVLGNLNSYMCHVNFTHSAISPTPPLDLSGDLFQSNTQYQLYPW